MKITLLLLFTLLLLSCQNQPECNCEDFKTGKFEFVQKINGKNEITTFERTEKFQIETYNGRTDTASVRWINDCEFILQKLNPRNMAEKKAISMKFLTTKNKTYIFEYSFVGDTKKQQGTVTKIN